jgi:hypothetical protein
MYDLAQEDGRTAAEAAYTELLRKWRDEDANGPGRYRAALDVLDDDAGWSGYYFDREQARAVLYKMSPERWLDFLQSRSSVHTDGTLTLDHLVNIQSFPSGFYSLFSGYCKDTITVTPLGLLILAARVNVLLKQILPAARRDALGVKAG